ncbi:hypothetical protein A6B44_07090 [Pasteurella skyensis]|uniref:IS110 family transposase n=1 Tax=Phocoenobacter skyensis TaxID=97481 RepID=UPI00159EA47A|nr:IS110 family transposase [Pasteurella skyensis]QLB22976.1 hypothetical protein A6B44_07090 [Pasteurella skyensis]
MNNTFYIGIDIACKKFDVAIYKENKKALHNTFDNDKKGFESLLKWINKDTQNLHVVMEATGIYWEELAYFLYDKKAKVSVINPKCIKAYGIGQNLRNKTDKIDAMLIARFAAKEQPQAWQPPPKAQRALLLRLRQLEHLKQAEQKERTRIKMMSDSESISSAERLANFLREEIKAFEKQIDETIKTDTMLKQNAKLLSSIPELGKKSVAWLLAYLGDGSRFKNGKAAAAYAGLTPMHHQSGSSINGKPRISKIGQTDIRKILFMPAVAYSFGNYKDRIYKTFVDNLLAKGKDKKVIIVALMRKLVAIAQTVLKNQMPFDASLHQKTM